MAPRTTRHCPHCDTAIESSATFCTHCGQTLPALGATHLLPPTRSSVPRGSPLLWVITIGVLGVVLGLVGVLWSRVAQPTTVSMLATSGVPAAIPTANDMVRINTPNVPSPIPATAAPMVSACLVPDVIGLDQGAAEGLIARAGLQPVKSTAYDSSIPIGAVISQDPSSGTRISPCAGDVTVIVSSGNIPPNPTVMPVPTQIPPTSASPLIGLIPFRSPGDATVLNPAFEWQRGSSEASNYELPQDSNSLTVISGPGTSSGGGSVPVVRYLVEGDFETQVKVTITPHGNFQAGCLSLTPFQGNSFLRLCRISINDGQFIWLQGMPGGGGGSALLNETVYVDDTVYFKIVRRGSIFNIFYSLSGSNWVLFRKDYISDLPKDLKIDLAVGSSTNEGVIGQFSVFAVMQK